MKRIGILIALMLPTIGMWAQRLTEQEAMDRALQYLNGNSAMARAKTNGKSMKMTAAKVGAERIYAFNRESGGYVIASADSRTLPVLGYADSGSIDWEQMPENMRTWLRQYDKAIATLGDCTDFKDGNLLDDGRPTTRARRAARAAVRPLLKSNWAQLPPYNNLLPIYGGNNPEWQDMVCIAGCVAVALAQVLNYWQWPQSLPDGLPAYDASDFCYDPSKTWHVDSLPPVTFDWENILNTYEWSEDATNKSRHAVATLMRYCSQALKSDCSPVYTNAIPDNYHEALVDRFGFSSALHIPNRELFSIDEWEEMIYGELAAGRPVIYGGESAIGDSHSFVCDGYLDDGYFHFNWGWYGDLDGYYALSVLNPYATTNPNRVSEGLGFLQGQDVIIGLDPHLTEFENPIGDKPEFLQHTRMSVIEGNTVLFQFHHLGNAQPIVADYALGTIEPDGTLTPRFLGDPNDSIVYIVNLMYVDIDPTAFQPGETLRLHPMLRARHTPDASWQTIPPDSFYVDAGRTADGKFFITYEPYKMEYVSAAITAGRDRIGATKDLSVQLRSHEAADHVVSVGIEPYYYGNVDEDEVTDSTPFTVGEMIYGNAQLRAGEVGEAMFLFTPMQGGLVKFNLSNNNVPFGSFMMKFGNTVNSYDAYLTNNSYVTHEGNHYVYHVELCDRPGVAFPDGVPPEGIYLYASIGSNENDAHNDITLTDELRDYLRALPDSAGSGNYKFTVDLPLDVEQDGSYYMRSYLNEWLDDAHSEYIIALLQNNYFTISVEPTSIQLPQASPHSATYDLNGRRLNGLPARKRIYISNGKKTIGK